MSVRHVFASVTLVLVALPAQARFGKSGSASSSSSSSSTGGSSSSAPAPSSHAAVPVRSGEGAGAGAPRSTVHHHATSPAHTPRWGRSPWGYGYYSGWFVPPFGYGYGYAVAPVPVAGSVAMAEEPPSLRVTAGLEAMTYVVGEAGLTVGATAHFEGERWGVLLGGQNIAVASLEGPGVDLLQQAQARLTYAFLTGRFGRLRAEVGADAVFASDLIVVGPSLGLNGTLWVGGPVALEGTVLVTPFPFWQLDYRAGLAVGLGPVGLRAGWRTQVLDDRGLVDGVVHRDVFMGPYVGASIVF